jgi:hypothetical protein
MEVNMKLTPLLLSQIIDENDIENFHANINDEMVIQVKAAYSIANQKPAKDSLVIKWLIDKAEYFQFSYNQFLVRYENEGNSYYDWTETDEMLGMAWHYAIDLKSTSAGWHAQRANKYFTHMKASVAILGVISQLDEGYHAYAS